MLDFLTLLQENPYPGRGILVSRDLVYYFIMGRSANSRNRIFVKTEDGIRTEAHDPAKLEDPSLIIYHPVRTMGDALVVTNGDQTDTICQHGDFRKGLMTRDLTTNSMIAAAAGADARMAGAPVSVVANSGSGNQGITATMPVVAAARWLDIDEPTMLRAVTLSNLIAIRIKSKFGRLSNLCGATVAGSGAACGITYLLGGGFHEICCAIQNMVGNVTGMVCDGAKADCALKISTCVNAACQAAAMGARGVRVQSTDGIVEENVERTLDNFAILSTHGTSDSVILDLMLNKEHTPDAE